METRFRTRAVLCLLLSFILSSNPVLAAANLDLPPNERPQIRNNILSCQTMLTMPDQIDDSVGIPFSTNSLEDFEKELTETIKTYGVEKLRDGTFYVLGVPMQDEKQTQHQYKEVLARQGLEGIAKVVVLSIPANLIKEESAGLARDILQRVKYSLFSPTRDLQRPQWGEILSDWQATLAIESVNVYFLFKSMSLAQASLVVTTHAIVLNAYMIFSKSLLNFLLRKSFKDETMLVNYPYFKISANEVELFLKQMALSMPFVLNYAVFGRLSEILNYYSQWGWEKTLAAFPYEISHFASTQGLTLALQTIFYSQIVTKGFGGWVDRQTGDQNTRDARTLRPLLQTPALAADAVLLMMASADWHSLLQLGSFDVNSGHVGLIGLTAGMALFFKKFPNALQPILSRYQSWKARRAEKKEK